MSVEVRRLQNLLFWIKPLSKDDYSPIVQLGALPKESILQRIDRRTEILGFVLHPFWIRMEGIPLRA